MEVVTATNDERRILSRMRRFSPPAAARTTLWHTQVMDTDELVAAIEALRPRQRQRITRLLDAMALGVETTADPNSDIATADFVDAFGDYLESHHAGSAKALSKENFEYAMVASFNACNVTASKSESNTLPGQDIEVDGVPWSLKSEAAKGIKLDRIHISKFMELGKGAWVTSEDMIALRERMFDHLKRYDRIFTLRCIERGSDSKGNETFRYELVEIPKSLFMRSRGVRIKFAENSKQSPIPASCFVPVDPNLPADGSKNVANTLLELYFDGGSERKLQIRKINKDHCVVHATWKVTVAP